LRQVCDPFEISAGRGDGQLLTRERSPKGRDRQHTSGVSGLDVVNRIADEYGIARLVTKAIQRGQYGLGMRFVSFATVAANDPAEVLENADVLEPAAR
jgi:hypothetical protein